MLVFDPFVLLFLIFLGSFVPGAILSVSVLKNSELRLIEKIFLGFGLGFVLPQLLPIALLLFGIKYSFAVALAGVVLFYIIAIYFYVTAVARKNATATSHPHEDDSMQKSCKTFVDGYRESTKPFELKLPDKFEIPTKIGEPTELLSKYGLQFFLVLVIALSFWVRLQSYSPVFQELDPYYYTYIAQQVVTIGENPLDDKTAWYPELEVDHRFVPILGYMEALWYELYTLGSANYDNMLLVTIASTYPPIAGALAIFFLYLLFSSQYKREYSLIAAGIASFIPIFLLKTAGGEMEIQPYGFFGLSFFLAMYAWTTREKEFKNALPFIALSIIAYVGLGLGSASAVVALAAIIIFVPLQSILLFLKGEDEKLKTFTLSNAIVFLIGVYLFHNVIYSIFDSSEISAAALVPPPTTIVLFALVMFSCVLIYIKQKITDFELRSYALLSLVIAGLLVFAFTPLKEYVSNFALGTIGIAKFKEPLHRTIAEQGTTGGLFQGMLGFMAATPSEIASILMPIEQIRPAVAEFFTIMFALLSGFANYIFLAFSTVLNTLFDAGITYDAKESSLLLVIIALTIVALVSSLVKSLGKRESTLFLLFAAIIFPPAIVGILKAKYTIYMGYFFAGAIAMVFGEAEKGLCWAVKKMLGEKDEIRKKALHYIPLAILTAGIVFAYLQFSHEGFASSILANSIKTRFQDNPLAQKANFEMLCNQLKAQGSYDEDICTAAKDPTAYASKGTNYQFSTKLCTVSLTDNPLAPTNEEKIAINFRCQRISDYWIESMEWIRYNTEQSSRTTSWWDYGHWINYFGQKNTVLRNEHASLYLIGEVAHTYIDGSTDELIDFMKKHDTTYALFDAELLMGGGILGGKYGALNYLSCARNNETTVKNSPGTSQCEMEHLWEIIYVPQGANAQNCTISAGGGKTGLIAYTAKIEKDAVGNLQNKFEPMYCIGEVMLASGQKTLGTYYLNRKYGNGDLKLNKAVLKFDYNTKDQVAVYTAFYTKDRIWLENGEIKDGYEDRKGKFYDSNLYKAFFLEELQGFDLVFKSKGSEVKIYKLRE